MRRTHFPLAGGPGSRRAVAALLFVRAIASALYLRPDYHIEGGGEPIAVAENLIREGSFGNPFLQSARTGPTAHLPPLSTMFLALLLWMFPGQPAAVLCVLIVHGLHAALLPYVSRLLFDRATPGLFGAGLCIGLPVFAIMPIWDAMYTATGLMLFGLLSWRLMERNRSPLWAGGAAGLLGAVLVLTNPAVLPVLIAWILFLMAKKYRDVRSAALFAAAFALMLGVGCLPWGVRNYLRFQRFVFMRDNLGIELNVSNNDCAQPTLEANLLSGCEARLHPIGSRTEAQLLGKMGEVDYNRLRLTTALGWIAAHRSRFFDLTRRRIAVFWLPPHFWAIRVITMLSLLGLVAMVRSAFAPCLFLAGALAVYPVLYYFVQSDVRYRYPIMWISLLAAGYLLDALQHIAASRIKHLPWHTSSPSPATR